MKKASKVLYIITMIFLVIGLLITGATFAYSLAAFISPDRYVNLTNDGIELFNKYYKEVYGKTFEAVTAETLKGLALIFFIVSAVVLIVELFVLCVMLAALRNLKYDPERKAAHIFLLICGILSLDVLLILASAFGISTANNARLER